MAEAREERAADARDDLVSPSISKLRKTSVMPRVPQSRISSSVRMCASSFTSDAPGTTLGFLRMRNSRFLPTTNTNLDAVLPFFTSIVHT